MKTGDPGGEGGVLSTRTSAFIRIIPQSQNRIYIVNYN